MTDKNNVLVSRKWAKALMELAQEDNNVSKEEILDDLREIAKVIASSAELSDVIANPSISTEEKQVVLSKIFQNNIIPMVYNFLYALNLRKRLDVISQIAEEFAKELDDIKNTTHVSVTSAIGLADERKENIAVRLSEKLQKKVVVDWTVDSDIIAGLVMNVNETIIDNSVKHKLEDLSKNIIKR